MIFSNQNKKYSKFSTINLIPLNKANNKIRSPVFSDGFFLSLRISYIPYPLPVCKYRGSQEIPAFTNSSIKQDTQVLQGIFFLMIKKILPCRSDWKRWVWGRAEQSWWWPLSAARSTRPARRCAPSRMDPECLGRLKTIQLIIWNIEMRISSTQMSVLFKWRTGLTNHRREKKTCGWKVSKANINPPRKVFVE